MTATEPSSSPELPLSVVPDRERVMVIPHGDLDAASAGGVDREIRELRRSGFERVVLDLSQVSFIDSVALRILLSLRNDAKRDGYQLTLIPGPHDVQRIFDITVTRGLFDWES